MTPQIAVYISPEPALICALAWLLDMGKRIAISIFVIFAVFGVKEIEMVPEYLKSLSGSLIKVMKTCATELEFTDGIMLDFYQLWKQNYEAVSRDAGCVLHCMSLKLDLFNVDGKLEHGNTKEFVMKHGAGANAATQLEDMVQTCHQNVSEMTDDCLRVLELAKCIREGIHQVNWQPNVEVVIEEVLAEV
ncbi:unnamed protein product [Diatraea saccharalis]|uniref:Pheromone binding protein 3 n=1 Tax=Diatraea saccharalis TaxID=40085 RepID=A0A9N9WLS1_9NEOP|nr:unnamed protein product [Diatraea saccharalis]